MPHQATDDPVEQARESLRIGRGNVMEAGAVRSAHVKCGGIKIGGHKGVFTRVSKDFDEHLPPAVLAEFIGHSLNVAEHLPRRTKKKN